MNHYTIDDITLGMTVEFSKQITQEMMENFQKISGDDSSIHIDSSFAKKRGFKDRVVYGMLSSVFFSTIVGVYLPGENGLLKSIECDYLQPVYIDDVLHIEAMIEAVYKTVGLIKIKVIIKNDKDDTVASGKIKALVV